MRFEPSRLAKYDREAIIEEMVRVANKYFEGKIPVRREFDRHSRVHWDTLRRKFGSWEEAWREAGFEYVGSEVKAAAVVADLKRVQQIRDGYFSYASYRERGGLYCGQTIRKKCGMGWAQILDTVLNISRKPSHGSNEQERPNDAANASCESSAGGVVRYTPEYLLADLRAVAAKLDDGVKVLSRHDYQALGGKHCNQTFCRVFGSWKNAVRAIGLTSGEHKKRHRTPRFSEEQYFQEIQRVWEILGRQPNVREMKLHGSRVSATTFTTRFGSWLKAIHAFCQDRNAPDTNIGVEPAMAVQDTAPAETAQSAHYGGALSAANNFFGGQKRTPRKPSNRLRWKVFVRDRFTCQACGRSPANMPGLSLEVDHVTPYSGGGETVLENLWLLCCECNSGKSDSPPILPQ